MILQDKRALRILAVAGVALVVLVYFELTSGSAISPSEAPTSAPQTEPPVSAARHDDCRYFFTALGPVAHDSLSISAGSFVSVWDGREYRGCEVSFVAHDSLPVAAPLPDFDALPETEMYRLGWRMSEGIGADGPGSGVFGIEREAERCIVRWAQPAHIDDDGEIVHADTFRLTVQCLSGASF